MDDPSTSLEGAKNRDPSTQVSESEIQFRAARWNEPPTRKFSLEQELVEEDATSMSKERTETVNLSTFSK